MPPSPAALRAKADRLRAYWHDIDSHPDRKPRAQVARELLACRRAGTPPRFYLERLLYQRAAGDPANYLSSAQEQALWDAKHRPDGYYRVYADKTLFDDHYRRAGEAEHGPFSLPAYLGQTRASVLLRPDREDVRASDRVALADALADMAERSPTGRVFAKPAVAKKGAGAFLVRRGHTAEKAEEVRQGALGVDYLFQEAVDQHPEMNRLHPNCLNTLRIVTGTMRDGSRFVLSAIVRVGRGDKPIDNAHAGGLIVGVDRDTGRLRPQAQTLFEFGGESYARHPESGVVFGGFEIPYFAEAADLAQRALGRLPLLYAGWDVGITPEGPVLIEGNEKPYLLMMEVANGGFKADPVARAFLQDQGILS